jgi:hypothetical protein
MGELNRLLAEKSAALQCDIEREGKLNDLFEKIAKEHLAIPTLEPRNLDRFDFHECGVWSIKMALKAAYEAGQKSVIE